MASSGKKKTTMAKMQRENKVRERRAQKQHRKEARKHESSSQPGGFTIGPPNDVGLDVYDAAEDDASEQPAAG
jgi:hypothetical protein